MINVKTMSDDGLRAVVNGCGRRSCVDNRRPQTFAVGSPHVWCAATAEAHAELAVREYGRQRKEYAAALERQRVRQGEPGPQDRADLLLINAVQGAAGA